MSTVEKILSGMFFLIGVIIIVRSGGNFNNVISNVFGQGNNLIKSLQGRGQSA